MVMVMVWSMPETTSPGPPPTKKYGAKNAIDGIDAGAPGAVRAPGRAPTEDGQWRVFECTFKKNLGSDPPVFFFASA